MITKHFAFALHDSKKRLNCAYVDVVFSLCPALHYVRR